MKNLKEITQLLTKKHLKKIDNREDEFITDQESNYYQLFKGIEEGKYLTDDDAAQDIYHTHPSNKKYLMLKSRLKEKLLNSLFFLDVDGHNDSLSHKANYTANRNLHCAKILLLNNARNSAIDIVKSTLTIANQYQFTDIVFSCAKILRNHASLTGLKSEYNEYHQLTQKALKVLEAEILSEHFFESFRMEFVRSVSIKPDILKAVSANLKKLQALCRKYNSSLLHFNMFRIWIMLHQVKENYEQAILICHKATKFLKANPLFYSNFRQAELSLIQLECCLHRRDYKSGTVCAEECKKLVPEGTTYRLVFLENYFLLAMHTENYRQAEIILNEAIRHPKYSYFSAERHEKWKIFDAYLQWILSADRPAEPAHFNIYKFLNEVPIFSKDKRGYNVAILIAQILFLIDRKEFSRIIEREDTLKVYRSEYLKMDTNFRSNCFIRMLLIMIKCHFDYESTRQGVVEFLEKMKSVSMKYQGNLETLEVIPYEILWGKILARLKNLKGKIYS